MTELIIINMVIGIIRRVIVIKKISYVLSDESRHKELCTKARGKAVESFDSEKVARQYAELYREVLG